MKSESGEIYWQNNITSSEARVNITERIRDLREGYKEGIPREVPDTLVAGRKDSRHPLTKTWFVIMHAMLSELLMYVKNGDIKITTDLSRAIEIFESTIFDGVMNLEEGEKIPDQYARETKTIMQKILQEVNPKAVKQLFHNGKK